MKALFFLVLLLLCIGVCVGISLGVEVLERPAQIFPEVFP
jgi:hypothetical protein